jgi:hypothetical protein
VFKCNVRVFLIKSNFFHEICCLAIPDDGMDVDRAGDEDKDNDPDKVKENECMKKNFMRILF